jgi:hypothetical protein
VCRAVEILNSVRFPYPRPNLAQLAQCRRAGELDWADRTLSDALLHPQESENWTLRQSSIVCAVTHRLPARSRGKQLPGNPCASPSKLRAPNKRSCWRFARRTSLGRLLLGQSRRSKAPPMLADIRKWLTKPLIPPT